jgi:hypothetical protein
VKSSRVMVIRMALATFSTFGIVACVPTFQSGLE